MPDHQTFSVLATLVDHPGLFTVFSIVIVVCVFMAISLPRVLKYLSIRADNIKDVMSKLDTMMQHIDDLSKRLTYVEEHVVLNTSNTNDATTMLKQIIREGRERDLRIAALTLNSNDMPNWDRMDAALEYFHLGGNHNAETTVVDVIVHTPDGVNMWNDKVAKFKRQLPEEPMEYITSCLKSIRKQIA